MNHLFGLINRLLNGMPTIVEMLKMYDSEFFLYPEKKKGFKLTQAPPSQTLPVKEPFKRIKRRMGRM